MRKGDILLFPTPERFGTPPTEKGTFYFSSGGKQNVPFSLTSQHFKMRSPWGAGRAHYEPLKAQGFVEFQS
jgi:hypothetical protein